MSTANRLTLHTETPDATAVPLDELVERISELVEAGHDDDIQTLIDKHPQHAERLRSLLPAIEAMASMEDLPDDVVETPDAQLRQLGDFHLLREIGRGGMGLVYEAEQISLGRRVALKVLPLAAMLNHQQLDRFKNEARAAATLKHPHIVGVYSVGVERGVHYYAMELVEGLSLADVIAAMRGRDTGDGGQGDAPAPPADNDPQAEHGNSQQVNNPGPPPTGIAGSTPRPLSPVPRIPQATVDTVANFSTVRTNNPQDYYRQMARLVADAADALDYAHNQGIIHRDIKPANLLVDDRSHVWITDFGLARLESDAGVTLTGDILGTLRYMSPEQAAGKSALVDYRTDIHALGATLFELLTLRPVFDCEDRGELLRSIIETVPPPLRQVGARIPVDLETIVAKTMEKEPADRYESASALAADLRAFVENCPIVARPPTWANRMQKWARRHVVLVTGAIGLLIVATALLSIGLATLNHAHTETALALDNAESSLQFARQAVDEMYTNVVSDWLADDLELTDSKQAFLEKALRIYQQLADGAPHDPLSQWEVTTAYTRIGQIQHKLGQYRQAKSAYQLAIEMRQELLSLLPDDPDRNHQLAANYRDLGRLQLDQEEVDKATAAWDASQRILAELNRRYPGEPDYSAGLAASQLDQAGLLLRAGKFTDAELSACEAQQSYTELGTNHRDSLEYKIGRSRSRILLARVLRFADRLDESEKLTRRAEVESATLMDDAFDSPALSRVRVATMIELSDILRSTERFEEAAEILERARTVAFQSLSNDVTPDVLMMQTITHEAEWTRSAEPEAFRQFLEVEMRRGSVLGKLGRTYEAQQVLADTVGAAYVLKAGVRPTRFAITELNARALLAELLADTENPEAESAAASTALVWARLLHFAPDAATYTSGLYSTNDYAGFLTRFPGLRATEFDASPMNRKESYLEARVVMGVANAVGWYRASSPANAISFLDEYADVDSGADSFAWYYLAMAYEQSEEHEKALQMYQQASEWMDAHKPDNAELTELRRDAADVLAISGQSAGRSATESGKLGPGEEALLNSPPQVAR